MTLGGASSCPYDPGETAKYSEFYPDLFPGNEPLTQATMATSGAGTFQTTPVWNVELPTPTSMNFNSSGSVAPSCASGSSTNGSNWLSDNNEDWKNEGVEPAIGVLATLGVANVLCMQLPNAVVGMNFKGAMFLAAGAGAMAVTSIAASVRGVTWKSDIAGNNTFNFSGCNDSPVNVNNSLRSDRIFMPTDVSSHLFEADAATRLQHIGQVQPALSQIERPRLSASHTFSNGVQVLDVDSTLSVASGRMDTPLGFTLHMKNEAPYPYGGPSAFYTEFNPAKATINAGAIARRRRSRSRPEYLVHPTWSNQVPTGGLVEGDYEIPLVVEHSGTIDTASMIGSVFFRMKSVCEPLRIFDDVEIPLEFLAACSDVALGAPLRWLDRQHRGSSISGPDNHPTDVQSRGRRGQQDNSPTGHTDALKDPVEVEMRMGSWRLDQNLQCHQATRTSATCSELCCQQHLPHRPEVRVEPEDPARGLQRQLPGRVHGLRRADHAARQVAMHGTRILQKPSTPPSWWATPTTCGRRSSARSCRSISPTTSEMR